jgi:hypothetical protein
MSKCTKHWEWLIEVNPTNKEKFAKNKIGTLIEEGLSDKEIFEQMCSFISGEMTGSDERTLTRNDKQYYSDLIAKTRNKNVFAVGVIPD